MKEREREREKKERVSHPVGDIKNKSLNALKPRRWYFKLKSQSVRFGRPVWGASRFMRRQDAQPLRFMTAGSRRGNSSAPNHFQLCGRLPRTRLGSLPAARRRRSVFLYPHFGTGILRGLRSSQLLHQHGAQVLWRTAETTIRRADELAGVCLGSGLKR